MHGGGGGLPLYLASAGIGFAVPPFPAPAGCGSGRTRRWGQRRRRSRPCGHRSIAGVPRLAGIDQRVRRDSLVSGGDGHLDLSQYRGDQGTANGGGLTARGGHQAPSANPGALGIDRRTGFRAMALVALVTILPLYLGNELQMGTAGRGFHVGLLIAVGLFAKPVAGLLSDRLGRKNVLVPGLLWSCLVALALTIFDTGMPLTIMIALLGLFLYPDQPILTAAVFDVVGSEVASTGLGIVACIGFLMAVLSPIIAGALYETLGFAATIYYIGSLFVAAALVFAALPLARATDEQSTG